MHALILAPFSARCLDRLRERIDVTYESWLDTNVLQDPDELGARLHRDGIDALVVEADFVFEELFDAAPALRFVGVCRNALNHVDLDSATAHGVAVVHAPGRNTNAVAEMTLGLIYKPQEWLWIRPEARYDWTQFHPIYTDGTRKEQLTLGFDVILVF